MLGVVAFLQGCSVEVEETRSFQVELLEMDQADFVDFLYEFGRSHRLTMLWFGWYNVETPKAWYEKSGESNFKLKLELLTEEFGYIFASNDFDIRVINLTVSCGEEPKPEWNVVSSAFVKAIKAESRVKIIYDVPNDLCGGGT